RFAFRNLTPGPYLVRAHLQGYVPERGRIIQVNAGIRNGSTLSLTRRNQDDVPRVLAAGVGGTAAPPPPPAEAETHDHGELAWRLRHLKRSVLKDVEPGLVDAGEDDSLLGDSLAGLGRAVGAPARFATGLLADVPFSGQINLLTSTSFDRPQDLFTADGLVPRGVAYLSLAAPTGGGEWAMRGAMTQGDLASWILAGSYVRRAGAAHEYEAGLSYGMQRYLGGNADALAAMTDGSRNAGSIYAYDDWALNPQLRVSYGGKYSRYDYLTERALFSPRASITVRPSPDDSLQLRGTVSRREIAPGAEEFLPPSTGVWLPPERTFSPVSSVGGFAAERVDHLEIAMEREWAGEFVIGLRAFRQHVDDQLVTLFGGGLPGTAHASLGHYYVGSAGDFEGRGWGVSVSRAMVDRLRTSVDYTQVDSRWVGASPDARALAVAAASAIRTGRELIHDLTTTLESVLPGVDTRVFVLYKINSGFVARDVVGPVGGSAGARFHVQVNQALPFMNFTSAHWEMLVAVRDLFRDDLLDSSVYDELLVVRPPKRVVGGVTVKF
ncbi:MAG TPA: TonB-dependent receptor, partial [Vicinamibacterales bacterium]